MPRSHCECFKLGAIGFGFRAAADDEQLRPRLVELGKGAEEDVQALQAFEPADGEKHRAVAVEAEGGPVGKAVARVEELEVDAAGDRVHRRRICVVETFEEDALVVAAGDDGVGPADGEALVADALQGFVLGDASAVLHLGEGMEHRGVGDAKARGR